MAEHSAPDAPPALPPLRSVHTASFPAILEELGISLLVTTYQAGKLVILRSDGGTLNTHFRNFNSPMGLAVGSGRLALGTANQIQFFRDLPAAARRLEPIGKHDACFLLRGSHFTGNIQIHEMSWGGSASANGELWFVNTRFSCLCTTDGVHSFVPRWRPPFVTGLAPEDRCHLNGLGMFEGRPRWVTALGVADTPAGWRANKKDGGILLEVPSGNVLTRGLSMPHSPRWYGGHLWVLNSGTGGLGVIEPNSGEYRGIVELPGFTRGLDFCGPVAFVGLSQVRESAVFSGIPIAEQALAERNCGVWAVDVRTGQVIAFVRFEDAVQEIFAVQVLPNARYPDLLNESNESLVNAFELPDEALRDVPGASRSPEAGTPDR